MGYEFKQMNQKEAEEISEWHYQDPYSFYDMKSDQEDYEMFLDPVRRGEHHYSVYRNGELVGFFSVQPSEHEGEVGLGVRPDWTGRGIGESFVKAGLSFLRQEYGVESFSLSVATFNNRAIKVYERCGFVPDFTFLQPTNGGEYEFLKMKYEPFPSR